MVSKQTWCLTSTETIRLIRDGEVSNIQVSKYSTLHTYLFQIFRVCEAAFPSKKNAVFFKSSQRPRSTIYVKHKIIHRMKCVKLLNELSDISGPNVALKAISRPTEI